MIYLTNCLVRQGSSLDRNSGNSGNGALSSGKDEVNDCKLLDWKLSESKLRYPSVVR